MERILLDEAYRKLKGSVYTDKTLPYIRSEIARFENENFEHKMETILDAINDEEKWKSFESYVITSIKAFTFPKKISDEKCDKGEPIVISNVYSKTVCIDNYNNFIDISIEGHILGILWILLVGYKIDSNLPDSCFGKRLCDRLVFSESRVSESPNLFKPYYSQYETWRNQGLKYAKNVVNQENQSVIITMLDLSRYYYNINYTESKYEKITAVEQESNEIKRINKLIFNIMKRYSELLGAEKKVMLPIGFLPSNILSNIYLSDFDEKARLCKNSAYYGRYVDDIILVSRINPYERLNNKIKKNGVKEVSAYMLKKLQEDGLIEYDDKNIIRLSGYEGLYIQKDKLRFFYVDKNGYDTIIEKIKSDIAHKTSEFSYLPEGPISESNEKILQFEREDTVNKLRALNGVAIDKYALAKAIGQNIKMSPYVEGKEINDFVRSIEQLLNYKEILNNYTQWEGVLNYYVINEKWNKIFEFTAKIVSALKCLDENTSKKGEYEYLNNNGIYSVGDTLLKYYISCLTRSMAIVWGKKIRELLEKISLLFLEFETYNEFQEDLSLKAMNRMRKYYCYSRMVNCSLIPISIEECMQVFAPIDNIEKEVCFNKLDEYFISEGRHRYAKKNSKYKPFISSPFEILYTALIKTIKENRTEIFDDNYWLDFVCNRYAENFNNKEQLYLKDYIKCETCDYEKNIVITVKNIGELEKNKKYRIAVANVKMRESDFEDILAGKQRDISKRCTEISKIVNEAIRYRSDILLFPEAYIPLTFLPVIQAKAAAHNMVIIGGIEHIKRGSLVYNLTATLIPLVNSKMRYVIPFFHSKVYYSPGEESAIATANCRPVSGKGHTLFKWNNVSFVTFCCYELTSLEERSKFKREADIVFGVEWNKDTSYFSNIIESLSRDRCCFCAQSNMSVYGDSRIVQPTQSDTMNIARIKGGINGTVVIDEIDIEALRKHINLPEKGDGFKPLPAGY